MVMGELVEETEVLVIGGGPGGYAAAFRAADLGMDVTMVDTADRPGGECLYRGCIPSKTLLYLADLIHDAGRFRNMGVSFDKPGIDLDRIRDWKNEVIDELTKGLVTLAKKRGVQLVQGKAVFEDSRQVRVQDSDVSHIKYKHAILAAGSRPVPFKGAAFKEGGRVMESAGALELQDIPESLLILGGGYVGLEAGTIYASLGSRVTVAVHGDRLLRAADTDLVEPLIRRLKESFETVYFNTKLTSLKEGEEQVDVTLDGEVEKAEQSFSRVLIAIGRQPSSKDLGIENTKVELDERGFVKVDDRQRTSDERIFAVGDIAGPPLLAHKAFREGKVAAEVIAGRSSAFDVRAVPAVVYTDPQVAWCGLTEEQARKEKRPVKIERFLWRYSGRAVTMDARDGLTKMILDPETGRVLGVGIAGRDTEGLIAEGVLAVEMGALAEDVGLSIHPHPTLTETLGEASEQFTGTSTHLLPSGKLK
jgi:dihydrolipoamide dehydrogenase